MKRLYFLLTLFFSILLLSNVSALEKSFIAGEALDGIAYMKYDGTNYYYRNAKAIRVSDSNDIAYCISPFIDLVENIEYAGYDSYDSIFELTEEQWDRVKLYAYYGYGFGKHKEQKWISITQMSIWRYLYPNDRFEWIDNTSDKNIIQPFDKEVEELEGLVNSHYLLPNISNQLWLSIDDEFMISDSNNMLNNYIIESTDFKVTQGSNYLKIYGGDIVKSGKIVLSRNSNIYSNKSLYFFRSNSQSVIERGNIDSVKMSLGITIEKGSITINKYDSDNNSTINSGEAILDGAVYELFDENMDYLNEVIIENNVGLFEDLSYGKYFIKEKSAGLGYYVDDETYEINISHDNLNPIIILKNNVIKSKIKIIKYYGTKEQLTNNTMLPEKNIIFEIYDINDELIDTCMTDENGSAEFVLPYGKYKVKQINTTENYEKVEDIEIVVDEENSYSTEIILYDMKIEVPNASIELSDINVNV